MPKSIVCKLVIVGGGNVGSNVDHGADVLAVTSETKLRKCKEANHAKINVCKLAIVGGGNVGSKADHDADVLAVKSETKQGNKYVTHAKINCL